jgi:superfamily II DNA/RNA helicase
VNDFDTIGVPQQFSKRLAARAITRATAVQRLVIPQLLEGKSVVFRSATGTGKTFAYLLPALTFIMNSDNGQTGSPQYRGPRLLVCAPTLELCSQIKTELDFLLAGEEPAGEGAGRQKKPGVALLIGSVSIGRQIENLKKTKPAIAVGNPGRILLLAKSGRLSFRALSFLVLDEADRLTAPECREETAQLAELISRECGKLTVAACSATMSGKTAEYLQPLLEEAVKLETDEHEILRQRIEHWAIFSEGRRKTRTLLSFIAAAKPKKTLVFTSRSYDAGKIVTALQQKKIAAAGLYSGMDKDERKNALGRFRSGSAAVLVSSDLAARGLDIPGISHVVSLDVGENPDVYVHRAGRTGRAGNRGIMICIGDEQEMHRLAAIEKKLGITVFPKELYGGRICAPVVPEME